jgi:hypothetical protein
MNIKKLITLIVCTISIALIITPHCFAKTIQKPLTPKQLPDMPNDRYIPIPTQQWTFVNKTNQPMTVTLTTGSVPENKWTQGYNASKEITTPTIKAGKSYTLEYQHMSPALSEVVFNFTDTDKGPLSTFQFTSRMDINDINTSPKGIITVKYNESSEPYVELE